MIKGQVAIVTGAGRGIGRAIALALAGEGAWVSPAARTRADVEAVARECTRLDILVNNVGLGLRKPFVKTTPTEWETMWRMNLWPAILCSQAAMVPMLAQNGGQIINIASRAGRQGEANMAAYSASKAGLVALTQALAAELTGTGVRVQAVCPGPIDTERMRLANPQADRSDWLMPEDVAQAVLSLTQPSPDAMNGMVLDLF